MLTQKRTQQQEAYSAVDAILLAVKQAQRDFVDDERKQLDDLYVRIQGLGRDIQLLEQGERIREDAQRSAHLPTRPEISGMNHGTGDGTAATWRSSAEFIEAVIRSGREPHMTDRRLLLEARATGMSEGVPADGGHLVQTDLGTEIMQKIHNSGEMSRRVRRQTVGPTANGIAWPLLDETSRANGSRWGGVRAYWTGEGSSMTASKPTFGKFRLDLDKITTLMYVTDEELQDIPGLVSLIQQLVPQEKVFKLEDGIINGSGAGMPLGILNAPATVSVAKETGQVAATVVAENVVKMWTRLWARSQLAAVWFVNQDIFPQLYTMTLNVGTGGVPLWMPAGGLSGNPYSTLFGKPVIPMEQCPTLGTVGDIILGDMGEYIVIEKGGIQNAESIHVQFLTNETTFRWVYRVNGACPWTSALTPFKGTANTVSPFVTLATRA